MNYISEQPMRRGFYTPPLSPTQMASEFENQISVGGGGGGGVVFGNWNRPVVSTV